MVSAEHKFNNQNVLKVNGAYSGDGGLLFNGVYRYKYPGYSSYLRFFADGKVVEVESIGNPYQVARLAK